MRSASKRRDHMITQSILASTDHAKDKLGVPCSHRSETWHCMEEPITLNITSPTRVMLSVNVQYSWSLAIAKYKNHEGSWKRESLSRLSVGACPVFSSDNRKRQKPRRKLKAGITFSLLSVNVQCSRLTIELHRNHEGSEGWNHAWSHFICTNVSLEWRESIAMTSRDRRIPRPAKIYKLWVESWESPLF